MVFVFLPCFEVFEPEMDHLVAVDDSCVLMPVMTKLNSAISLCHFVNFLSLSSSFKTRKILYTFSTRCTIVFLAPDGVRLVVLLSQIENYSAF